MSERARIEVDIRDFKGMITESDDRDIAPGASPEQINLMSEDVGIAKTRPGFLPVTFEDD